MTNIYFLLGVEAGGLGPGYSHGQIIVKGYFCDPDRLPFHYQKAIICLHPVSSNISIDPIVRIPCHVLTTYQRLHCLIQVENQGAYL